MGYRLFQPTLLKPLSSRFAWRLAQGSVPTPIAGGGVSAHSHGWGMGSAPTPIVEEHGGRSVPTPIGEGWGGEGSALTPIVEGHGGGGLSAHSHGRGMGGRSSVPTPTPEGRGTQCPYGREAGGGAQHPPHGRRAGGGLSTHPRASPRGPTWMRRSSAGPCRHV